MTDESTSRRRFLRAGSLLTISAASGCLRFVTGGNDTTTETPTSRNTLRDSDGDGVVNTEDYAPWDEDVQEKSDLVSSAPTDTPTATDTQAAETGIEFEEDFEDGDYADTFEIERQQSDTDVEVNEDRPKSGTHSLNVRVGNTGSGDVALGRAVGEVDVTATYSAWIYPNSTDHNIHFSFRGENGHADLSFNAAQHLVYRTDEELDAEPQDRFGNPILIENPEVNRWYEVSITVEPSENEVRFRAADADGDSWGTEPVPATADFTAVRLGGTDYHGNFEFYADSIELST